MDGRRRLAEAVTDGAHVRPATGAAPERRRMRGRIRQGRGRFLGPLTALRLPRGAGIAAALVLLSGSIGFGVVRGGHAADLADQFYDFRNAVANAVGFHISTIQLIGQHQLSGEDILATAGITPRSSLLFLDAANVRARLKANPWIAEANVLKLYPGRLHIKVTEREAFALWQKDGKISVIAADGAVVAPYDGTRFADLPQVVGAGAETRAKDFLTLLDNYPLISGRLRAAVLIAERHWNVVLDNGIEVKLPQQDAAEALEKLVHLDHDGKILSRDIAAIDLRLADRVTVQLSDEAAAARAEALKLKTAKKKAGAA
jgi:cell division protein FtsQ